MILLLDVDGTLAHFNQKAGVGKVREILSEKFGQKGLIAGEQFAKVYKAFQHIHHGGAEPRHMALREKIFSIPVANSLENLTWSRELWLKYVAAENRLQLPDREIISVIDSYWKAISLASPLHSDSESFFSSMKSRAFLAVSSDHRLALKGGNLSYDAEISHNKKVSRIFDQGFSKFFKPEEIITGDPFDKPSEEFWKKAMQIAGISSPREAFFVDDSKRIAVSAAKFGFRSCLIDRDSRYSKDEAALEGLSYITELGQLGTLLQSI